MNDNTITNEQEAEVEAQKKQVYFAIQLSGQDWDNLITILGELPAKLSSAYIAYFISQKELALKQYEADKKKETEKEEVETPSSEIVS
jgi:ribosomal protein L12E/L44/L45/RPP1/RPP2